MYEKHIFKLNKKLPCLILKNQTKDIRKQSNKNKNNIKESNLRVYRFIQENLASEGGVKGKLSSPGKNCHVLHQMQGSKYKSQVLSIRRCGANCLLPIEEWKELGPFSIFFYVGWISTKLTEGDKRECIPYSIRCLQTMSKDEHLSTIFFFFFLVCI